MKISSDRLDEWLSEAIRMGRADEARMLISYYKAKYMYKERPRYSNRPMYAQFLGCLAAITGR